MGKINKFLLMVIAMVMIMIAAVGIDKGLQHYNARKWETERVARYEQARADVADMQLTISQLSQNQESIEAFIEENRAYFDEVVDAQGLSGDLQTEVSENELTEDMSGNMQTISGNEMWENDLSGNTLSGNEVTGGDVSGNTVSENEMTGEDVSGNSISGNEIVDGMQENTSVSDNSVSGNQVDEMTVSGNTLLEKRKIRSSYVETQMQNEIDLNIIAGKQYDFSGISIACLGDSITEAANLSDQEDYQQYAYPARLKELLGAESVVNLGIGGSSIGRYWADAFVDRYQAIPQDADLIIVMGGTNDGFCLNQEEFGTMEERKERTFIGDLDELLRGLKENYPNAKVVLATPLPNVLHDMLRKERDYLLPQYLLVNAMKQLAEEYDIPVIDLYNSNILDTHDAAVIYNYMPDGVHCNPAGYQIMAEHFAAELVKLYEGNQA